MSKTMIRRVEPRSPAAKAGVQAGETLVEINGKQILDVLDYKFYSYDARLTLTLQAPDGASRTLRVRKEEGEDLGLEFETYLMDRARSCANNCIFCFVDQMPPGMRESLYFKDDDARLSFLMGNYLTLTNLSQREVQRIIDLRISPINVSVHTTDRSLRVEMLKNRRAGESIEIMRRFARHQITMNCQIVSCPGINDGPALDRTLRDLAEMFPAVHSVSVVPVGVTKYREGLYPLRPYTREEAGRWWTRWRPLRQPTATPTAQPWSGALTSSTCWPGGPCRRRTTTRSSPSWTTGWGCSACCARNSAGAWT